MQKVLLHICCGVCASPVVRRLQEEGFSVSGFFYNPNIHPQAEFLKRKEIAHQVARILQIELVQDLYDQNEWLKQTSGMEQEPEGGSRCLVCFRMRLEATWQTAKKMDIERFATTLSVSPHKNTAAINAIGRQISPRGFLIRDFKKDGGFKLAIEFSKRYNLYRQNYCGCIYSRQEKNKC